MYADDLAIVVENKQELQGEQEEWKEVFKKYGLRMMWVEQQRGVEQQIEGKGDEPY